MAGAFGSVVKAGELRYLSPSSLERGDGPSGCQRKWWYKYVGKVPDVERASQFVGTQAHAELAQFAKTGIDVLGPVARRAKPMVPRVPGLLIEHPIATSLDTAPVRLDGIPLVGYVDLAHDSRENRGGSDIEDTLDPEGTVEVIDYKTASSDRYYKSGDELRRSVQMVTYGEFFRLFGAKWLRLSHVYIRTDAPKPAAKRTILVPAQEVADRFGSFVPAARLLRQAARAATADDVEPNLSACSAFGGCQHRSYCTAAAKNSLSRLFGDDPSAHTSILGGPVSLLSSLLPQTLAAAAPPPYPAGFAEACAALDAASYGWPALGGAAATAKAAVRGVTISAGSGLAGSGQLAGKMITDPLEVVAIGDELRANGFGPAADEASTARIAARATPPAPAAAPPAPVVAEVTPPAPVVAEVTPPTGVGVAVSLPSTGAMPALLPPDAPAPTPPSAQPAAPAAASAPVTVPPPAAEPPKKERKPRTPKIAPATAGAPIDTASPSIGDGLEVYVDCAPSHGAPSLWPLVDEWVKALLDAANHGQPPERRIADIRSASGEHPFAFGKWKGILAAHVKEQTISGAFVIDTRGSELAEVVAEALRSRADLYVRGWR